MARRSIGKAEADKLFRSNSEEGMYQVRLGYGQCLFLPINSKTSELIATLAKATLHTESTIHVDGTYITYFYPASNRELEITVRQLNSILFAERAIPAPREEEEGGAEGTAK